MKRTITRRFIISSMSLLALVGPAGSVSAMQPLDDQALGNETGQAAFYTSYIDPAGNGATGTNSSGLGFFTLGLQGTVALNANINHLQLGCGGVNGPQGCDIDLSQVRLHGLTPDANGNYAGSDATLTNPFIQLAIKNPTSLSTRQVVGVAFGSQGASGMLSIGQNPLSTNGGNPGKPGGVTGPNGETGINSLSGNLQVAVSNLNVPITISGFIPATATIKQTATQPFVTGDASGTGTFYQYLSGNRITGGTLGNISLNANLPVLGVVTANATLAPENLIDVHNLIVSSTSTQGMLLSLNSMAILWPQVGTSGVYSFPNTNTATNQTLNADGTVGSVGYNSNGANIPLQQLQAQTGWFLSLPQASIGGTAATPLTTANVNLSLFGAIGALAGGVNLPSVNLQQVPTTNCYGGYKFC